MAGGICRRKVGSSSLMASATATVFVPGWRCTASMMARVSLYQAATLSFSTLGMTVPTSPRRTGAPFR